MFKKSIEEGIYENIRYVNGKVQFKSFSLNVYCYEVDGVLVDTGARSLYKLTKPFFETLSIDQVILTHHHEDHTGGAHFFDKRGVPIFIHPESVDLVRTRAMYPLYRKVFWGTRKPFDAKPIGNTFESRNATWDVIHTPGHTSDHCSFLNRETGMLFTGDLYVSPKIKVILRNESIPQTLKSIEHALTYDFDVIVCQHAGIVENGRDALKAKRDTLQQLVDQVLDLHQKGMDPVEIHQLLFPVDYPIKRFSMGEWDSLHVVTSILNEPSSIAANKTLSL